MFCSRQTAHEPTRGGGGTDFEKKIPQLLSEIFSRKALTSLSFVKVLYKNVNKGIWDLFSGDKGRLDEKI